MHDLRHSAAALLLSKGVAVKVVSEMLGHADGSTTLSIYAHVLPDMQGIAADAADQALGYTEKHPRFGWSLPLAGLSSTFLVATRLSSTTPAYATIAMVLSLYALAMRAWSSLGAGPEQVTRLSRYGAGWEHVSFIDVGQGHGVLVSAGGETYLIDAGRPEEQPNVVDFLRSRGVNSLHGIVVTNPPS